MAQPTKPEQSATRQSNGRTPIMVSIGPIPEWSHIGISSLVPNQRLLLVPSQDTDCMSIVDLQAMQVRHTVQLPKGSSPWHARATPDGRLAFVSYSRFRGHIETAFKGDSEVGVIDIAKGELVGEVKVMGGPVMIETDGRRNRAYVTNRYSNTLSVIDVEKRSVIRTVETGAAPFWVRLSPKF
jgi:YVTN family beta-propeller protein